MFLISQTIHKKKENENLTNQINDNFLKRDRKQKNGEISNVKKQIGKIVFFYL